jgi:hypothetical protein
MLGGGVIKNKIKGDDMEIIEIVKGLNVNEWILISTLILISFGLGWIFHSERNIPKIESLIDGELNELLLKIEEFKIETVELGSSIGDSGVKLGDLVNNLKPAIKEAEEKKKVLEWEVQQLNDNGLIVEQNKLQALYDELEKFGNKMIEDNSVIGQLREKGNTEAVKAIVDSTKHKLGSAKRAVSKDNGGGRTM